MLLLQAAPEAVKNEAGELVRKLHCYVVFTDHAGACQAKRILQITEQMAALTGAADVMRVRFCKPQNVTALCTPTFRAFVTAQWAQSAAVAKANPEYKKALCRVNALFVSKLHQHITTARLNSLFGKFGPMIACEVGAWGCARWGPRSSLSQLWSLRHDRSSASRTPHPPANPTHSAVSRPALAPCLSWSYVRRSSTTAMGAVLGMAW